MSRRRIIQATMIAPAAALVREVAAQPAAPAFTYPVGRSGQTLGDGFMIRHGYVTENTWYNPGWLYP